MTRPQILELAIDSYKNLNAMRQRWDSKIVLYGPNGSGKTNVLECILLLGGSHQALWEASPRLQRPKPGAISAVLKVGPWELPGGPTVDPSAITWWESLAVSEGAHFIDSLRSAPLPAQVRDLLADLAAEPLVRFALKELDGPVGEAREVTEEPPSYRRSYWCTWCLPGAPPAWLIDQADELPDAFGPLRLWLAEAPETRSPYADLLVLPEVDDPPLSVQWVPRARSGVEQMQVFEDAIAAAAEATTELFDAVVELAADGRGTDPGFFVMEVAVDLIARELARTLPSVTVEVNDDRSMYFHHDVWAGRTFAERTGYLSDRVIDLLSDGERVWVDEALGSAAHALNLLGHLQEARESLLLVLEKATPATGASVLNAIEAAKPGELEDVWLKDEIDPVLVALDEAIKDEEAAISAVAGNLLFRERNHRRLLHGGTLTVRVFDEPERHQHPLAVRRIASALDAIHADGTDVVISTHSHALLDSASGTFLHLHRGSKARTVPDQFCPAEVALVGELAASMGLTRGELLGLRRLVLLVEGIHDEIVLDHWFGPQLRAAGVLILPIHGTDNLPGLTQLKMVGDFLEVPVGVLLDASRELPAVKNLQRAVEKSARRWHRIDLIESDIVYYLPDQAMEVEFPAWPGWGQVRAERKKDRMPIKAHLKKCYGKEVSGRLIRRVLAACADRSLGPPPELARAVSTFLALAQSADVPSGMLSSGPGPESHA